MTKIIEIWGDPVAHSKSPEMHNAAYKEFGLDFEYRKRHVKPEDLEQEIKAFREDEQRVGLNITIPHKENIIPLLDEVSPFAKDCGAVNTVVKKEGELYGFNTDGPGYWRSLKELNKFEPKGKNIAIFGDGGAAKAIVGYVLHNKESKDLPESVSIGGIIPEKTKALANKYDLATEFDAASEAFLAYIEEADLVINATPLGMEPSEKQTPLPDFDMLSPAQTCSDVVYTPQETLFLKNAQAQGCNIHFGYGMLVYQGVLAFELHTGTMLDDQQAQKVADIMKNTILEKK